MRKLLILSALAVAGAAHADLFNITSNQLNVRVPLPGQSGGTTIANSPAGVYPITFTVSGVTNVTDVDITLNFGLRASTNTTVGGPDDFAGREHTFAGDMEMLLVSPLGTTCFFMSDAGGFNNLRGRYTFDDEAAGQMSAASFGTTNDPIVNGSYKPSAYTPTEVFFAPAPGGVHGLTLAGFDGADPNGTWSLYIMDDAGGDWGYLDNAALNITGTPVPEPATMAALGLGVAALLRRRRK
jgi:hypothetical protein